MRGRAVSRRRLLGLALPLSAALAVWNNLVVHRLPASYVAANATATAAVLGAARWAGLSREELGLARRALPAGLRWGSACAVPVAAGYALGLAVPALRPLLLDGRVAGRGGADLAHQALVRIPVGTVLWEEVAFRGVLLAVLQRLVPPPAAVGASSVLFGVWHVRPTLEGLAANDLARGSAATGAAVLLGCVGTAAAGVLFSGLRLRSGSLLAPALLHLATNSIGVGAAAAAVRLS
ncbi:MAG TPA: CPBP family intramembrane glutamic endopeptidase [Blastococcus sp.]|nr:CPBP family intramembrane glutamic endopeptidase [Blastococcus sp.]